MLTKIKLFPSTLIFVFILTFVLISCKGEPTPVVPKGDPIEAAHDFMTALYEGDTDKCRSLSSSEVRDSVAQLCRSITEESAAANIDLSETQFEVTSIQSTIATITMSGRWTIRAVASDGQASEEVHDTETESPLILYMIYEDDRWRFHDFGE